MALQQPKEELIDQHMKKQTIIFAVIALMGLTSCTQRGKQHFERSLQFTNRDYIIEVYSGGAIVFKDSFNGIINQEKGSDGFYYIKDSVMIEISGDYIIRSKD